MENQNPLNLPESNVVNQPASQLQNSSTNKTNLFLPVLVTFLVSAVVFGFGGYFLGRQSSVAQTMTQHEKPKPIPIATNEPSASPTSDTTSQLKTYINDTYGYSIRYEPSEGLALVSCGNAGRGKAPGEERLIFYDNSIKYPDIDPQYQCITQGENHLITIIHTASKDSCQGTESWKATEKSLEVGGVNSSKCEYVFVGEKLYPGSDERTVVSIPSGNQYILVNLYDNKFTNTYNELLSNFRFTQ